MRVGNKLVVTASLAIAFFPCRSAFTAPRDNLESVLQRLDHAAMGFHSASAAIEIDNIQTDPVPDADVQKGVVYYKRDGNSVFMAVHIHEHNMKQSEKAYTVIGGVLKLFEPGINQVTTCSKCEKFEGYVNLGFGSSGKDLQGKWNIKYLGSEILDGVKTEILELVPKDLDIQKNLPKSTIWVDPDRAVSLKVVIARSSTSSYVCRYSNFKMNQALPDEAFNLKTNHETVYQNH
jgi:outer membrane lipoprotein-sorting protein